MLKLKNNNKGIFKQNVSGKDEWVSGQENNNLHSQLM